ncbi:MAG: hypothetical protein WCE21_00540, partial [Candidatus Babeliales bacterium]
MKLLLRLLCFGMINVALWPTGSAMEQQKQLLYSNATIQETTWPIIKMAYRRCELSLFIQDFNTVRDQLAEQVGFEKKVINKNVVYSHNLSQEKFIELLHQKGQIQEFHLHTIFDKNFKVQLTKKIKEQHKKVSGTIMPKLNALEKLKQEVKAQENRFNDVQKQMIITAASTAMVMGNIGGGLNIFDNGAFGETFRGLSLVKQMIDTKYLPLLQADSQQFGMHKKQLELYPLDAASMRIFDKAKELLQNSALHLSKKNADTNMQAIPSPQPLVYHTDTISWELFPTDTPPQVTNALNLSNISYTKSIQEWIQNPSHMLETDKFTDINSPLTYVGTHEKKQSAIKIHTFPLSFDQYIKQYGTITHAKDNYEDYCATMPGAVHDNKERTMGYYIYLFNG